MSIYYLLCSFLDQVPYNHYTAWNMDYVKYVSLSIES